MTFRYGLFGGRFERVVCCVFLLVLLRVPGFPFGFIFGVDGLRRFINFRHVLHVALDIPTIYNTFTILLLFLIRFLIGNRFVAHLVSGTTIFVTVELATLSSLVLVLLVNAPVIQRSRMRISARSGERGGGMTRSDSVYGAHNVRRLLLVGVVRSGRLGLLLRVTFVFLALATSVLRAIRSHFLSRELEYIYYKIVLLTQRSPQTQNRVLQTYLHVRQHSSVVDEVRQPDEQMLNHISQAIFRCSPKYFCKRDRCLCCFFAIYL